MVGFALMVVVLYPMATNWGILFQFAIGLLTVAVAYYGHLQSKKGREEDHTQKTLAEREAREIREAAAEMEDKKQRFSELERSLTEARKDLAYYSAEADKARQQRAEAETEKTALEAQWQQRHTAALSRCETTVRELRAVLASVNLPPQQRDRIIGTVEAAEDHIRSDHDTYSESDNN